MTHVASWGQSIPESRTVSAKAPEARALLMCWGTERTQLPSEPGESKPDVR